MPYAFNLTFDLTTSLAIEQIYGEMAQFDIPDHDLITQYGPCVTVMVLSDRVSTRTVSDILDWKLRDLKSFEVAINEPFILPGSPPALSLRVSPTQDLLTLHHALFSEMPEEEIHLLYRPPHWQPHIKLANFAGDKAACRAITARVAANRPAFKGTLTGLEVMQYPPAQAIWQAMLRLQPTA